MLATKALVEVLDETSLNDDKYEYVRGEKAGGEAAIYSTRCDQRIALGKFVLAQRAEATPEESQSISLERIAAALERIAARLDSITSANDYPSEYLRVKGMN